MLLVSISALSQSGGTPKFKRINFGIVFSPDYCYRLLRYHPSYKWVERIRNIDDHAMFGYTTGLGVKIDLKEKIVLETGLYFSIKGEQTKKEALAWAGVSSGYPMKSRTRFRYKFIDLPLKVHFVFGTKRILPFVSAGFSATIFSEKTTKVISEFSDGHTTFANSSVDLGYRKFNLVAIVGTGVKYETSGGIVIIFEPVYRQFINSIMVDAGVKERPFSIGANVGLYYIPGKK